jgi:NAD(P)-dependent dehydrogenase (short-subunit alcohol dehydrogenase family)
MLTGKTAVVTGGGRGLGRAVAVALARAGAAVVVAARSADQLAETESEISNHGGKVLSVALDVSQPDDVQRLRDTVRDTFGTAQILINAAGVFGPIEPIGSGDCQRWIETITVNTIGPYLTCRAFVDDMVTAGWGRIVNFSSAATLHEPGPLLSAYGTSKVALNHFTRHLAAEIAGSGVTANVIHPGEVQTAMWSTIRDEAEKAGPLAGPLRDWVVDVGRRGGDDPQKAVDLVLSIISEKHADTSGKFLWIEDGQQQPIPSW